MSITVLYLAQVQACCFPAHGQQPLRHHQPQSGAEKMSANLSAMVQCLPVEEVCTYHIEPSIRPRVNHDPLAYEQVYPTPNPLLVSISSKRPPILLAKS